MKTIKKKVMVLSLTIVMVLSSLISAYAATSTIVYTELDSALVQHTVTKDSAYLKFESGPRSSPAVTQVTNIKYEAYVYLDLKSTTSSKTSKTATYIILDNDCARINSGTYFPSVFNAEDYKVTIDGEVYEGCNVIAVSNISITMTIYDGRTVTTTISGLY